MQKVRIGFVGVGGMGQAAHLRNYVTNPECEVVALAEIRTQLRDAVGERFGIAKVYPSHEELLANEELDGIVAIQLFSMHPVLVPELLKKGVPVLTEKPLADTLDGGQALLRAERASKAPLFIAYHKRSDPATGWAKKQMAEWQSSGAVGKLRYIRVTMPPGDWVAEGFTGLITTNESYSPPPLDWNGRYAKFVNYYIHQVNLIRFLLGEDYRVISADPQGLTLTGLSPSGVVVTLEMAPYNTTVDWQEKALIAYERGYIELELPAPLAVHRAGKVAAYEDPGGGVEPRLISPTLPFRHAMREQAANFIRAIRGEANPLAGAEEALKDLELATEYIQVLEASEALWNSKQPATKAA